MLNEQFIKGIGIDFLNIIDMDYDVANSYFLVNTIAHECYHYFQYTLENMLIKGDSINDSLKSVAYLYFICLNDQIFTSYNQKFGIYNDIDISLFNLYSICI